MVSYVLIVLELKKRKRFAGIVNKRRSTNENISGIKPSSSISLQKNHSLVYSNNSKQLKIKLYSKTIYKSSSKLDDEVSNDRMSSNTRANRTSISPISKTQMKTTKNVVILIIMFFCSWFPYAMLTILIQFVPNIDEYLNIHLATIPPIFAKTSAIVNPIIYALRNSRFRVLLKRTLKGNIKKTHDSNSINSK